MDLKISIIIPVYNVEDYIEECVRSVLRQITDEAELIVIDDGSTDNSLKVIKNLQKENSFTVITQKNSGVSVARNKGMSHANGEYLVFIDSDDFWSEKTLDRLLATAKQFEPDMIRFNAQSFYEEGVELEYSVVNYDSSDNLVDNKIYYSEELKANLDSFKASPCLYLFKKSIVQNNHILFEENIIHEDQLFSTQLFLNVDSMVYLKENLYYRRYRMNSITTNRSKIQLQYAYVSYYKIIRILEILLNNETYSNEKKRFIKTRIQYLYNLSNSYPLSVIFRYRFFSKIETISLKQKIMTEVKNIAKKLFPEKVISLLKKD